MSIQATFDNMTNGSTKGIVHVFADGACKGNPGPTAIGVAAFQNTAPDLTSFKMKPDCIFFISQRTGSGTNNESEYQSLIAALSELKKRNITSAKIHMDSELIIKQMKGQYKVKNERLFALWTKATALAKGNNFVFIHVKREFNQIADHLANKAYES